MTRCSWFYLVGILTSVVLLGPEASGQDIPAPLPPDGMYRDELNLLGPEFMTEEMGCCVPGPASNVAACSGPFCGYSCRSEGIFFSVDLVLVDVSVLDGEDLATRLLKTRPTALDLDNLDLDVDPTARFEVGWLTCDGLGFQTRFWEYDNAGAALNPQDPPAEPIVQRQAWDVAVFDLEVTRKWLVDQVWDASLSGGYRFVEYEEGASLSLPDGRTPEVNTRYIGNGLTGALGVRRQVTRSLSAMTNARASLLLGGSSVSRSDAATLPSNSLDESFDARYILESQMGASYEYPICGGGLWFARGGYEVQYWNDFVEPLGSQTDPGSVLFHGFFAAVGLQR